MNEPFSKLQSIVDRYSIFFGFLLDGIRVYVVQWFLNLQSSRTLVLVLFESSYQKDDGIRDLFVKHSCMVVRTSKGTVNRHRYTYYNSSPYTAYR